MSGKLVRKKCTECKMVRSGTRGTMQWCERDNCAGEMRETPYGARRRAARGRR